MLSYLDANYFIIHASNDESFQKISRLADMIVWLSIKGYLNEDKIRRETTMLREDKKYDDIQV